MKRALLRHLVCPGCRSDLDLTPDEVEPDGEIVSGALLCRSCGSSYPVTRGVPRMARELTAEKAETADAFGWQWQEFVELHQEFRDQFLDWIWPIQPEFFRDKVVLDAGCGIGRHTYWAGQFGAREVIGVDLSAAVETAYRNVGHLANVHIVQADIYNLPFRQRDENRGHSGTFDFAYSIGVLHHLPDPEEGFQSMARTVKPGGTVFGWVYGHENNGIVHYVINPIRTAVTSRLPRPFLYYLSYMPAAVMQTVIKGIYRPVNERPALQRFRKHLYYNSYLYHLSSFGFRQNHTIVFDHLVAPTAFYIKRDEFEAWFRRAGLEHIELSWRNQNSWRGRGTVPGAEEPTRESAARSEVASP